MSVTVVSILIGILSVILLYFKWSYTYWKNKGVLTEPPRIPFGNVDGLFTKTFIGDLWRGFYCKFRKEGLPYGGAYVYLKKFFIPTDPDLIKCVLQKDFAYFMNHGTYTNEEVDPLSGHLFALEDEKWRNMRVKLTPTFTSGKMKMMFDTLANCSSGLVENINKQIEDKTPVDIKEVLGCFTTDIISSCAFGIESNCQKDPNSEFRKFGKRVFELTPRARLNGLLMLALPKNILKKLGIKMSKPDVEKFFIDMVKDTVNYREKNQIYRKDFMHLLIQLKNIGKVTDDNKITDNNVKETGLSINQIAAQAFVFFIAGFETSSTTMTFALYEIAINPDIQRKMREEVRTVLKKYDGKMTYDAVMDLHYMDKVINETLRKYPPVSVMRRECKMDYTVPGTDLVIEKGTAVIISTLGLHYDQEYYPNPTVFDPERFNEENTASRPSFTFIPFGDGPRICIGLRFGLMQSKVGLATLLNNYEITLNRKTQVPIVFDKNAFISSAEGGVWLDFKKVEE